ncbi:zinc-dependent alcohol dehydrogenase family protein [Mesorhizobium sp. M1D.F.Ca.ET.043.01.1.1]|uniref:zinc-dependent alcohol dehydrogenase family protein n=1 Tax=Mesorhizobium sp. M1D.F.Ca.ET.043.01.1.1 TaxID=2493669 RepID=UPI000F75902E|nr:zinc-dependent alcohol dehydrogenase family protein [Mesorhizobium sp. M1D.F.Ca.ET.043.01.1.1]AZO73470.1 NADPH:quinone reductase [Mesorhizobium sp. M1D.F.Ca.ET.043.01.1.1]
MTKVVRFHEFGGPEVLRIDTIDVAPPGPREVRIRVKAIGLNRAEALMRAGTYIETPELPSRLGLEAAGIVDAVGAGVSGFAPGDVVSTIPPISMIEYPAHGELATFPAVHIVKHPASLSFEAAAALWMQFLTAYGALIEIARLRAGDFVAITAASSSVGLAAIQIANKVGATPIAITRSSAKKQALLGFGATHVIAANEEDLEARLKAISGSAGVRVVLDAVGGSIFNPLTAAMSRGGILLEYGGLSPEPTPFPLFTVLGKCLTLRGYLVHEIVQDPRRLEAAKTFIVDGLTDGSLKPVIAKTFDFADIVEAYRYLESNEQFGKVVVSL